MKLQTSEGKASSRKGTEDFEKFEVFESPSYNVSSPDPESDPCTFQSDGWNSNLWNVPKRYVFHKKNIEIEFLAHGLPNHSGGCTSHYKFASDVITKFSEVTGKKICTFIIAIGSQFNCVNPTMFYNRIVEIRRAVVSSQSKCKFIFISQPFNYDTRHWPLQIAPKKRSIR